MPKNADGPIRIVDFIPALSGLIGKVALVSSFAVVWMQELSIVSENFVFENVRLEMIIGSVISLIALLSVPHMAPVGTLAPLVLLIPAMARLGVHPLIFNLLVGVAGIVGVKTTLIQKTLSLMGDISKTGLTLSFGAAGVILSLKNLMTFFAGNLLPLLLMCALLSAAYILLTKQGKSWLIIPAAALSSMLISLLFGFAPDVSVPNSLPYFDPAYWWDHMWGIGFTADLLSILVTLPFAFFVIVMWSVDTVSVFAVMDAGCAHGQKGPGIAQDRFFLTASIHNMLCALFGSAQTGSHWRSFLIPLFMTERPIRPAAILLCILGLIAGVSAVPLKIMLFSPLIWTVLLFGIFIPFVVAGVRNIQNIRGIPRKLAILLLSGIGVVVSPIITGMGTVIFEIVEKRKNRSGDQSC